MVDNLGIDDAVTWLTLPLFMAAFLMIFSVVHEVLPFLNEDDRVGLRNGIGRAAVAESTRPFVERGASITACFLAVASGCYSPVF